MPLGMSRTEDETIRTIARGYCAYRALEGRHDVALEGYRGNCYVGGSWAQPPRQPAFSGTWGDLYDIEEIGTSPRSILTRR